MTEENNYQIQDMKKTYFVFQMIIFKRKQVI